MKYIYEHGVRTFRGYFFWNRNPVDVTDRATLEAIKRESGFTRFEEPAPVEKPAPQAQPQRRPILSLGRRK